MNEKASSARQKALQERKRGQHDKAVKRLEQAIAAFPDELDLLLDAVEASLEGGEAARATQFLKVAQDRFTKDKDRIAAFVREKLTTFHDSAFARSVVENAVKLRDLVTALGHLERIPDHTIRDFLARARTKSQSLKAASHGGYSLRGEMLTNELASALLSIRLGHMKEGMDVLIQILDEKPVEQAILTPFLASLEGRHHKSGRVRFAHACAQCASGAELEAIGRFVEAVQQEPSLASLCIERLRVLRETSKARARVERALAEVYLLKGDLDDAAAVLRDYFGNQKDAGREVMLIVRPHLDPAGGPNACTWLALDASLTVEQSNAALEILRPLHQRGTCNEELLNWFETSARGKELTPEMRVFHASLAVAQKQYDRAVEVLRKVCAAAPQEIPSVLAMLDRHRTEHASLDGLYREYAAKDTDAGAAPASDDGFESFDNREFELPASPSRAPRSGRVEAGDRPINFAAGSRPARKSFVETREISFDDDGSAIPAGREPDAAPAADADGFEISDGPSVGARGAGERAAGARPRVAAVPAPAAAPPVTASHVVNVAEQLHAAGASAFFHVDRDPPQAEPEPKPPTRPHTDDAPGAPILVGYSSAPEAGDSGTEPAAPPADVAPAAVEGTFGDRLEEFRRGRLDGAGIAALMETAAREMRVDELAELLRYEPTSEWEDFTRRYYEAEHLVLTHRPLPALKILAALDRVDLTSEQKERVWFKLAVCQRLVRDFAAANETLARLVEAFPHREDYARLARTNFEQHLEAQSQATTVLVKTSSLD